MQCQILTRLVLTAPEDSYTIRHRTSESKVPMHCIPGIGREIGLEPHPRISNTADLIAGPVRSQVSVLTTRCFGFGPR
jgi:hypothetical protein